MKLQLKRSSALVSGSAKPPLASQLAFGEVAINYNAADPTIFIKDTNNSIVSFTDHLLPKAGGTLTGDLVLNGDPTSALMPATKQYTDNAISSLQSSITYPVTSVNNLTGAVSLDYTNVGAPSTSGANATGNNWNIGILGNSATTTSLATSRNIALTGDATGNVNFDGTADVSISVSVVDDSHNHVIANIDGLQTALNAKQDAASAASNALALNGKPDSSFVQTTYNSSLNSDSRNSRGVTRLYRRDNDSDYSIQHHWTGSRWLIQGYNGDNFHAGAEVEYATNADKVDNIHASQFMRSDIDISTANNITMDGTLNIRSAIDLADNDVLRFGTGDDFKMYNNGVNQYMDWMSGSGSILIREGNAGIDKFIFTISTGNFTASGDITAYSDVSLKTNIELISKALDKVDQINGVTFERTDIDTGVRQAGVIAQDVQKVLPEVVREGEDGKLTVAYGNLAGLLVEAIKELRQEVKELKGE